MSDRRELLKFLAASPLWLGMPAIGRGAARRRRTQPATADAVLPSAADALDVFDFEAMARRVLPPAHWGYMATGVDAEDTLRANPAGFSRYQLRVRRFVDVSRIDMSMTLFGQTFASPIALCPVGSQRAFHPEGELAVARAAQAGNHLQILSTQASTRIEDVAKIRGNSLWYQLYTTSSFEVTTKIVRRAEAAGCQVVAVTVDLPNGRNTLTDLRQARVDTRQCASCHGASARGADGRTVGPKPMFEGLDMTGVTLTSATLTWDFVKRLKDVTKMRVVIKGLETREDAELAVRNGADGIIVSNHGGRATETGRPTIDAPARGGGRRCRAHPGAARRRRAAGHRRLQGAGARSYRRRHRPALHLGPVVVRPGRRRPCAADTDHRAAVGHGRVRHGKACRHHPPVPDRYKNVSGAWHRWHEIRARRQWCQAPTRVLVVSATRATTAERWGAPGQEWRRAWAASRPWGTAAASRRASPGDTRPRRSPSPTAARRSR